MKKSIPKIIPLLIGKQLEIIALFSKKKANEKAFKLFCTPLKGRVKADQKEFLEKAKDRKIPIQGLEIQTYRWKGNGSTLLLIHGWDSNTYRWKTLIKKLQEDSYNIIALDAPAQGNSTGHLLNVVLYTDCVQTVIEAYQPEILIGHSVGGMTTVYNQYKYPNDTIQKLIVLGSPSELSLIMKGYQQTLGLSDHFMNALDQYFKIRFDMYYHEFSIAKFAKSVTQSGLIIHDRRDNIAPFAASQAIHKNWNNSQLMPTNGLGHSLHDDSVNTAILEFMKP